MANDRRQQRTEEGRVQKGGNNGIPFNPPPLQLHPGILLDYEFIVLNLRNRPQSIISGGFIQ